MYNMDLVGVVVIFFLSTNIFLARVCALMYSWKKIQSNGKNFPIEMNHDRRFTELQFLL